MKTNIILTIIFLLILFSLVSVSCKDSDSDTTKPVISLIDPADGEAIKIGGDMHLEMDLSDDVMLKSYMIEIHNNFDDHSHGSTRGAATNGQTVNFAFNKSYDLSGKKTAHIHHHDVVIPTNATPGQYHLMIYCTDASGNETYVARKIVLSTTAEEHHD